jgi:hypothetical protein
MIPGCRTTRSVGAAALLALFGWSGAPAAVDSDELSDLAARIQYAVYEEDLRGLTELSSRLAAETGRGGLTPLLRYHAAYAAYRAAELAPGALQDDGDHLARCEEQAEAAIDADPEFADARALAGACAALEGSRNPAALLAIRRARQHLRAAWSIAPDNPRVLLLVAASDLRRSGLSEGIGTPAELLVRAAERFRVPTAADSGWPDWGEAETAVLQAEIALEEGRLLDARDAAERALILAPDYRRAVAVLRKLGIPGP